MVGDGSARGESATATPPVLLLGFNRPHLIRRQIDNLRFVRPRSIFVNVDGPRGNSPDDERLRDEVLSVLDSIDWECEVRRNVSDVNKGLFTAVPEAISWFFEHHESGVILEDDCLVRPEFFRFSAELLDRYSSNDRVMHVSALSLLRDPRAKTSYVASSVGHVWGWATWKRAWLHMDLEMKSWPAVRDEVRTRGEVGRALALKFDSAVGGGKKSWARSWYCAIQARDGIALNPVVNLVENVGLGAGSTHTSSRRHPLDFPADEPLRFPLVHPEDLRLDVRYETLLARHHRRTSRVRVGDRIGSVLRRMERLAPTRGAKQ